MSHRRHLSVLLVVGLATAGLAPRARAYDSICRVPANPAADLPGLGLGTEDCPRGPGGAQGRYRDRSIPPLDEHRQIMRSAMISAGLPDAALETVELPVYVAATDAVPGLHSVMPVPIDRAARVETRRYTVDELAQLPDFSFSLVDWAGGNETCPLLPGTDPISCHSFTSHMGAANSNHFVPQADYSYARLHNLALARAAECAAMRAAIGAAHQEQFREYLEQCEYEALTIEAVAQHFLQDAWSAGHMWERWGSTDLGDFPAFDWPAPFGVETQRRYIAVAVAAISGLIHGSESLLGTCDRMCCPDTNTQYVQGAGSPQPMAGDLHLNDALDGTAGVLSDRYPAQRDRLTNCTAASVRQVYDALAPPGVDPMLGARLPAIAGGSIGDPTGPECHGARATNRAMHDAMALDLASVAGVVVSTVTFEAVVTLGFVLRMAVDGAAPLRLPDDGLDELGRDLAHLSHEAHLYALVDPTGTDVAALRDLDLNEMPLLGVHANSYYADPASTAPYQDPGLPWSEGSDAQRAILARAFNRGHATEWCRTMTSEMLDALRARARESFDQLEVCRAFAIRHLRRGTSAADYVSGYEPLCAYLNPGGAFIYRSGTDITPEGMNQAAEDWCTNAMDNASCATIHDADPSLPDGVYTVDPDGAGILSPFDVYCDMTTAGGGWTLVDNDADGTFFTSRTRSANTDPRRTQGAYLPGYHWSANPQVLCVSSVYTGAETPPGSGSSYVILNALTTTAREYPTIVRATGPDAGENWSIDTLNGNTDRGTTSYTFVGGMNTGALWVGSSTQPTCACSYRGASGAVGSGLGMWMASDGNTCSTWVR